MVNGFNLLNTLFHYYRNLILVYYFIYMYLGMIIFIIDSFNPSSLLRKNILLVLIIYVPYFLYL